MNKYDLNEPLALGLYLAIPPESEELSLGVCINKVTKL
jgi:hypothetical protein